VAANAESEPMSETEPKSVAEPKAGPEQLVLDLPHRPALALEDFLVGPTNEAAVALMDAWPDWTARAAIVVGPTGSGKSHLTNVWRLKSGAGSVPAPELTENAIAEIETTGALAVEDLDRGIASERVLFHLLNLTKEKGFALLATSRTAPVDLEVALPDLRSRLRALPMVRIESPDDHILKAVLVKLFTDRQLTPDPHVVGHLALHMERSFEAAQKVVEACDQLALARQRKVTRPIAAEALERVRTSGLAVGKG
jgi:chromosomal replication initiation ATPase DnaA